FIDGTMVAVDASTGPFRGRVYLFGNRIAAGAREQDGSGKEVWIPWRTWAEKGLLLLTSIDQGVNFGVPAFPRNRRTAAGQFPNAAAVLRDGSVIALFDDWDPPSRSDSDAVISYTFARSADGGRTVETLQ